MFNIRDFLESLDNLIKSYDALQAENIKLKRDANFWKNEWQKATGRKTDDEVALDTEIALLREQG